MSKIIEEETEGSKTQTTNNYNQQKEDEFEQASDRISRGDWCSF